MATDLLAWRGRNDDGNETTATWKANQGISWTQVTDVNLRVRFLHQQSAALVNNLNCQFQYSLNNVDWVNVTASSNVVRSSASANVTDAAATTSQLTGGSGTYIGATCFDEADGNCGGASLDVASTGQFETEYCCQVRDVDVVHNQTIYLRDWNSDTGAAWTTYSGGVASVTVSGTRKAATPNADPLGSYTDSPPTIDKQDLAGDPTPINVPVPADPWGNLDDSVLPQRRRIGWLDSIVFNKQVAGTTAIPVTTPADPMTMADQPPTVTRFGFLTATTPADSLGLYADQPPTISKLGFLSAVPPADGLANYADSISGLGRAYNLTGDSLSLQDQPPTVLRTGYLSAALPADARPALVDQGDITYGKRYDTTADSLNQWLDSATVEVKFSTLTVSLPPDSLNQWADDRTVDKQVVGSVPIDVNVPADSLNNWLDSPSKFQFGFIQAAPPADSLNSWADQPPTIYKTGALSATSPADSLNLWVDSANAFETIAARPGDDLLNNWADDKAVSKQDLGTNPINVTLPADALNNWVDAATSERRRAGWYDVVVFNLESLAGVISVSRTDALANYADTLASRSDLLVGRVVYLVDGDGNFIVDENGNKIVVDGLIDNLTFADSAAKTLATIGVTPINVALPADGLNLWADSPTTARFGYLQIAPPADGLANYVDALRHSKNFNLTDNLNNWVDAPTKDLQIVGSNPITVTPPADGLNLWADSPTKTQFGYLQITPPADSLANYADELRHSKNFNLTDNLNQWADAPAKDLQIVGSNPITVAPPADGLNQWADSPSTAQFGYRQVTPPADNLNQWLDSPTAAKFGYLNASTPVDNFNAWADSYQHGKGYSLPVDSLNQWDDSPSLNLQTVTLTVALTDSLNLWADAVVAGFGGQKFVQLTDDKPDFVDTATTSGRAFYQLTLTDNLGGYADAAPATFATLAVKPPADLRGAFVDSVEAVKYLAILKTLTDANVVYSDSATALVNGLVGLGPDSLLNYADSLNLFADLRTAPSGDGLANYLDSIASDASLFVALSDAMTVIDALAVGLGPFDEVILVLDLVSEIVRVIEIQAEIKHAIEVQSEIVPSVNLFWEVTA